jgi:hypothetical protein
VAGPERVGPEVGLDEQRVPQPLGARRLGAPRPQRVELVHRLLDVLRDQAEHVRRTVLPLGQPPAALRHGVLQRRLPQRGGEVAPQRRARLDERRVRGQLESTSSASTIV